MEKSDINQRLVKHQRLSFTPLQFSFDNWRELIALWWCNCKECNALNAIAPPGVNGKEEQKAINCQRSFTERKLFMIDEVLYHNAQLHVLQIVYISKLHVHIEVFFDCLLVENFSYITVENTWRSVVQVICTKMWCIKELLSENHLVASFTANPGGANQCRKSHNIPFSCFFSVSL